MSANTEQKNALAIAVEQLHRELAESGSQLDTQQWAKSLLNLAQLAASTGLGEAAELAKNFSSALEDQNREPAPAALEELLGHIRALVHAADASPSDTYSLTGLAQDPELLADFIVESREHLSAIEQYLLNLEKGPEGHDAVHAIFRGFHTIKGLAGFLELSLIQSVAHEIENLLDNVRQGVLPVGARIIDAVLEGRDYIGKWLTFLESGRSGSLPPDLRDPSSLIARVQRCSTDTSDRDDRRVPDTEAQAPAATAQPGCVAEITPPPATTPTAAVPAAAAVAAPAAAVASSVRAIKVNTDKLDHLVDMIGELVIAQSLVRCDAESLGGQNQQLSRNLAQLSRITNDVQRTAMSMRMVPVGSLFQKMARLVRDLGRKFDKPIEFETEGEEVELDRNIVEELADPLMHMVRNAVDHGIETEEQRLAAGKPCPARLALRAFHRAGQIIIEVADDGRGIDRDRVLRKATDKGLIAPGAVLGDSECFNLIFQPGFSTAENVSDISGRGVGMDVVRKQITRLRGTIDISSTKGKGTRFSLRLPLTLAIIDGLVVIVGTDRFVIPLASIRELLRPKPEMLATIEGRAAEIVTIRDQIIPLVRLHERFGIDPKSTNPADCVLVVADADGASFCLMVDEMAGKQEVVIKSLGKLFQNVRGVAGGAILGDGRVGLILDLKDLFTAQQNG